MSTQLELLEDVTDLDAIHLNLLISIARNDNLTVGELAEISNQDRGKTYRALDTLKNMGFVVTTLSNPIRVHLQEGQEIMTQLESRLNNDANRKMDGYLMLIEYLEESRVQKDVKATEFTIIKGSPNIWSLMSKKLKDAKNDVILLVSGAEFRRMEHSAIYDILEKLECKITIITDDSDYNVSSEHMIFLPNESQVQGKILLIDDSFVVFGKDGQKYNDPNDNCASTNNTEIVNQYRTLLEQITK